MEIKIEYKRDIIPLERIEKGSWIDLRIGEDVELKAGESRLIPLGVAMKLPPGYEALVIPRSSTFKKWGLLQTNSVGLIDNSYCGTNDEWMFSVLATKDVFIPKDTRICQFRIQKEMPEITFKTVDNLDYVNRGGFGSTGVN